jgi:hypothetical protein
VGWLVQLPLCLRFVNLNFFTNIVRDLFIPLAGRVLSFSNGIWDGLFFFNLSMDELVQKLPVLGQVAIFFAFQFKVFGRGRAETL